MTVQEYTKQLISEFRERLRDWDITKFSEGLKGKLGDDEFTDCMSWIILNFRGVNYNICIKNPRAKMKGITALIVDGNKIDGNVIPILSKDITHQVDVIL